MLNNLPAWLNTPALVLLGMVAAVLLYLLFVSLRNPIVAKLGVRNIPRRPTQTALIVAGLTLSTVIIVSALSTGDTLNYSVQNYAIDAYGEIDEIISLPFLSIIAGLQETDDPLQAILGGNGEEDDELSQARQEILAGTGYDVLLQLISQGLPGISNERYQQFREEALAEPLIDGVAPAILFPTILRNTRSGQGAPLGFIFAVDENYAQEFGLHNVAGEAVSMDTLNPGVGNVFQAVTDLFILAGAAAQDLGLDLQISDVAIAIAAAGAIASGEFDDAQANQFLRALLGEDAPQLPQGSVAQLQDLFGGISEITPPTETPESESPIPDPESPVPSPQSPIPALEALGIPDATNLLSALNLNILRGEIDRALGQFGLQLRQGDVYLSRLGAQQLGAREGDLLEIFLGPIPIPYRVAGIVNEAGPVATLAPVVMMEMDEAQRLLSWIMPNRVNAILISNQGDARQGLALTDQVRPILSQLVIEPESLARVTEILQRPQVLALLREQVTFITEDAIDNVLIDMIASVVGNVLPIPDLSLLGQLPDALAANDEEALRSLIANQSVRTWLLNLNLPGEEARELRRAVADLTQMEVVDPLSKQTVVALSGVAGAGFSSVFSVFGIFSIMAGVLLIFMIFVMLAAERRSEMGMARAIGMQRSHLTQMFITEGMLYDLAAAALGIVLGLGISYLMVDFISALFTDVSRQFSGQELFFQFQFNVAPASIIIAYCLGVLFTFLVVVIASNQISRLNIVTAIRDLPERSARQPRSWWQKLLRFVVGPALIALGAYVVTLGQDQGLNVILTGASLVIVGVAFTLNWLFTLRGMRIERRHRIIYSLIGLGLVITWGVPWNQALGLELTLFSGNPLWLPLTFAVGGPMLILGAILVVMFNADTWVWFINRLLGGIGALTPVLRTAIAYPLSSRFRTGMAMTMFAMVITTVVIMSIVIRATQTLVQPDEQYTASFDIQVNSTLLSFFDPVTDFAAKIEAAPDFPQEEIFAVGSFQRERLAMQEPGAAAWNVSWAVMVDEGFAAVAARAYPMSQRAGEFASDAAAWQALAEREDVALITANLLRQPDPLDPDGPWSVQPGFHMEFEEMEGMEASPGGDEIWGRFTVGQIDPAGSSLPDNVILRIRGGQGEIREVRVIGVLEATTESLMGSGVLVNRAVYDAMDETGFSPDSWYIAVKEGADARAVAAAVERSFLSSGLDATVMADSFAQGQQILRGILQLFQGFMALGLFVGIAALGVISSRTVVERRQQVGMLRAIGYQPGMVALSFVLESSFIALAGIGIGAATGIILGQGMIGVFFDLLNPGAFTIPWLEIGGILALAYGFSLLTTILPAIQASRIYPAEALRYE